MKRYNILVEQTLPFGHSTIQIMGIAFSGIYDLGEFVHAYRRATFIYNEDGENETGLDFADEFPDYVPLLEKMLEFRYQFESGGLMITEVLSTDYVDLSAPSQSEPESIQAIMKRV